MTTANFAIDALIERTNKIIDYQAERIIEGRPRLWICTVALLTPGAHTLLKGTAGVAKSMLFDGLSGHAPENKWFKTPAFKGSPPEQFLGPISLSAMTDPANERYERIVKGKFPWCEYFFIDELLRAPRAVLPVFQTGMSDGVMDNGNGLEPIPLRTMFAASNHWVEPGDDDLQAFNDRFIFKIEVQPVQAQESRIAIMESFLKRSANGGASAPIPDELILNRDAVDELIAHAKQMPVERDALEALAALTTNLLQEGIAPSLRRVNHLLAAMRTDAMLRGQDAVLIDNVQLARDSLWTDEEEREAVERATLNFASEFEQGSARLADEYDEIRAAFLELQTQFAQTGIGKITPGMTDAATKIGRKQQQQYPRIKAHLKTANGRDTSRLDAITDEMQAARNWIGESLLGGIPLNPLSE